MNRTPSPNQAVIKGSTQSLSTVGIFAIRETSEDSAWLNTNRA